MIFRWQDFSRKKLRHRLGMIQTEKFFLAVRDWDAQCHAPLSFPIMSCLLPRQSLSLLLATGLGAALASAQAPDPPWRLTNDQDHQMMKDLLGIKSLRLFASGTPGTPNYANYDERKAAARSPVPEVLTLKSGEKVTAAQAWWEHRRPEIVEDFDREIYGRVPETAKNLKVKWSVTNTIQGKVGAHGIVTKQVTGQVDNSSYPLLDVNISLSITTPADAKGPVPVIMILGAGGGNLGAPRPAAPARGVPPTDPLSIESLTARLSLTPVQANAIRPLLAEMVKTQSDLAASQAKAESVTGELAGKIRAVLTPVQKPQFARLQIMLNLLEQVPGFQEQLLSKGWGYASLNVGSIQADNGAGLTNGIIGLLNQGQGRKPEDWGVLRAWAWGASRALDYLETDKQVDAKRVGLQGISRWAKAAIVTMAYEPRFAVAYVNSAGEGGTKLYRHLVGETVENLTGANQYHWMAGNFLKYGGPLTVDDLPVDAHELIALCAPRPLFVSCGDGTPPGQDAWQDPHGMFMATALASPVYELLGKKGLPVQEMPTIGSALTDGELAFRQHEQGHTDQPNWPVFIEFASRYLTGSVRP